MFSSLLVFWKYDDEDAIYDAYTFDIQNEIKHIISLETCSFLTTNEFIILLP